MRIHWNRFFSVSFLGQDENGVAQTGLRDSTKSSFQESFKDGDGNATAGLNVSQNAICSRRLDVGVDSIPAEKKMPCIKSDKYILANEVNNPYPVSKTNNIDPLAVPSKTDNKTLLMQMQVIEKSELKDKTTEAFELLQQCEDTVSSYFHLKWVTLR